MLKHKKVAVGADDGNPDHVQAEDWNRPHVYDVGDLFLIARLEVLIFVGESVTIDWGGSARITSCSVGVTRPLDIMIDETGVNEMASSGNVWRSASVTMAGSIPVGHSAHLVYNMPDGPWSVALVNMDENIEVAQFPSSTALCVDFWGEVMAAV